jgi:hypothetical protein
MIQRWLSELKRSLAEIRDLPKGSLVALSLYFSAFFSGQGLVLVLCYLEFLAFPPSFVPWLQSLDVSLGLKRQIASGLGVSLFIGNSLLLWGILVWLVPKTGLLRYLERLRNTSLLRRIVLGVLAALVGTSLWATSIRAVSQRARDHAAQATRNGNGEIVK